MFTANLYKEIKIKIFPSLVFCLPPCFIRDASCIMLSIDWTPLGPRNHVLDGVQIFPRKGTLLGATLGHAYTCSLVYFPVACCLGKLFTPIVPLFTKQQNLVAALLRVVGVTTGLAESNGSLPPSLWLTSPAGWLPITGISSGTLCSVIEYGLPLPFLCCWNCCHVHLTGSWCSTIVSRWLMSCARSRTRPWRCTLPQCSSFMFTPSAWCMRPADVFLRSLPSSSSICRPTSTAYYSAVRVIVVIYLLIFYKYSLTAIMQDNLH